MIMRRWRAIVWFLLIVLIASLGSLGAQDDPPELPFPIPLLIQFDDEQRFSQEEKGLLSKSLLVSLVGQDRAFLVWILSGENDPWTRRIDLPGYLEVTFRKEGDLYEYRARYVRTPGKTVQFDLNRSDTASAVRRNPSRLFWPLEEQIIETVLELRKEIDQREHLGLYRAPLVIHGPPESRISFRPALKAGGGPFLIDSQGNLKLDLPAPGMYRFEVESPGFFPATERVALPLEGGRVDLLLEKKSPHALRFYLADGNVPGLQWDYSFGFLQRWFLRAGGHSYMFAMIPLYRERREWNEAFDYSEEQEYQERGVDFFLFAPLSLISLEGGYRFYDPYRRWHFYLSAGPFLRILHSDLFVGIDPLGPGGLVSSFGFAFQLGKRTALFGEMTPHLFFTENVTSLVRYYGGAVLQFPGPSSADTLLVLEHLRFGVRVQLF